MPAKKKRMKRIAESAAKPSARNGPRAARNLPSIKAPRKGPQSPLAEQVETVIASLKRLGTKRIRDEMGPRYGIVGKSADEAFGVSMANMKLLAEQLTNGGDVARNHELAGALWTTGWYEARMVASMVDEAALVTPTQMDRWCLDFDNWAICDTVCFKLFDRVALDVAVRKVDQWSRGMRPTAGEVGVAGGHDEFVKRAAFALLACVALHNKTAPDKPFLERVPLIEVAATDERNFVKKGVNWALRAIGRRNAALNAAAVAVANRLAQSENSACRWVGKDALRQIRRS